VSGRILVLGGTGRLGRSMVAELQHRGRACAAPARAELDVADLTALPARIAAYAPAVIVNLAGFTDVAAAERPENFARAERLNRDVPEALAAAAVGTGAALVHVSTDYVFDGDKGAPYLEDDPVHPLQVYGRTKLEGERAVRAAHPRALIVRVSTLFGPGRPGSPSFVDAIVRQSVPFERGKGTLEVVERPVASPTYAPDAASALADLIDRGAEGTIHLVNRGACSRLTLARATVAACYLADRVIVKAKPEAPGSLRRPAYAVLDTAKLQSILGRQLPTWRDALTRYIEGLRVGT
jgi:dTDP-4-dehydrorhamnose reductase